VGQAGGSSGALLLPEMSVLTSALWTFCAPHYTPLSFPTITHTQHQKMEDDRAATNLGPDVDEGISEEPPAVSKQPRRRFVGRKTAEQGSGEQADPNANIEDSSAIQGVRRLPWN
jgi:hypothetical protein